MSFGICHVDMVKKTGWEFKHRKPGHGVYMIGSDGCKINIQN